MSVQLAEHVSGMEELYKGHASFEAMNLPKDLLKGVYAAGFQAPSKIQEKALPILLANPPLNLIAQSQSGTGKTAAFSLAALSRVDPTKEVCQAIVLCPARELARQVADVISELGKFSVIKVAIGIKENAELRAVNELKEQILVGTPGTVMDLMRRKKVDPNNIVFFVLDEADNMLDQQGLGDQSIRVQASVSGKSLMFLVIYLRLAKSHCFQQLFLPMSDPLLNKLLPLLPNSL